jgi:hypothetical protein
MCRILVLNPRRRANFPSRSGTAPASAALTHARMTLTNPIGSLVKTKSCLLLPSFSYCSCLTQFCCPQLSSWTRPTSGGTPSRRPWTLGPPTRSSGWSPRGTSSRRTSSPRLRRRFGGKPSRRSTCPQRRWSRRTRVSFTRRESFLSEPSSALLVRVPNLSA